MNDDNVIRFSESLDKISRDLNCYDQVDTVMEVCSNVSGRANVVIAFTVLASLHDGLKESMESVGCPADKIPVSVRLIAEARETMEQALAAMLRGD